MDAAGRLPATVPKLGVQVTVPRIGGRNWESPPADCSEVEGWNYQLLRGR